MSSTRFIFTLEKALCGLMHGKSAWFWSFSHSKNKLNIPRPKQYHHRKKPLQSRAIRFTLLQIFQWIETTGLVLKRADSQVKPPRPESVCSIGKSCRLSSSWQWAKAVELSVIQLPIWPRCLSRPVTSASQLLHSGAYCSGSNPCVLPVTDADHVFCFSDVKIMRDYFLRRFLHEGFRVRKSFFWLFS